VPCCIKSNEICPLDNVLSSPNLGGSLGASEPPATTHRRSACRNSHHVRLELLVAPAARRRGDVLSDHEVRIALTDAWAQAGPGGLSRDARIDEARPGRMPTAWRWATIEATVRCRGNGLAVERLPRVSRRSWPTPAALLAEPKPTNGYLVQDTWHWDGDFTSDAVAPEGRVFVMSGQSFIAAL
jgi:hypothetical protein